jgi:hypothetical protein
MKGGHHAPPRRQVSVEGKGATDREITDALPGDELLPDGGSFANALDVSAPPGDAWAWIAQIGRGRAGFWHHTASEPPPRLRAPTTSACEHGPRA